MKQGPILFLKMVIFLIGISAIAVLLWEPHIEGRNANATLYEIYFKDPFLAFAYIASISFFVALYQAFKLLGHAGQNNVFSREAIKALRTIKYCAIAIIVFVAMGEIYILFSISDDRAGGVFIGALIAFGSIIAAAAANILESIFQNGLDIKSEKINQINTN